MAFLDAIVETPAVADTEAAQRGTEALRAAASSRNGDISTRVDTILEAPVARSLIEGICGGSPYLSHALAHDVETMLAVFEGTPEEAFAATLATLDREMAEATARTEAAAALRRAKRRAALAIALADVAGFWPVERVVGSLSTLAERTLDHALGALLRERARLGRIELVDEDVPTRGCGIVALGMGKLGAGELNFSSDIDLIVLFDGERVPTPRPERVQHDVVQITRDLVTLMQERTADGYVFRTDLRLRPDPASTPLAVSVHAAEVYYESVGQNWERAAMLKARPVAGDREVGDQFLETIRPFVWRRHLDFWAIRDVHSIKRQINAAKGGSRIAVDGHDVKVGRGGIREIEFYAQTQQLIWGGREPDLRVKPTLEALDALVGAGHVEAEVARGLADAYRFLRRIEHRLQMVDDHQTHSLPKGRAFDAFARFMGYADPDEFRALVRATLESVERHYADLFEDDESLGSGGGNLVFTGADDDPGTIETLHHLGFREPGVVIEAIRGWHRGSMGATRSQRARELLTELVPRLLEALGRTADPDHAFRSFDAFLHRLPAGVQLFALFQANPPLLDLVAEIMGSAPLLAHHLSRHPIVLDAVLSSDFFEPFRENEAVNAIGAMIKGETHELEDVLTATRRCVNDLKFRLGVQVLRGRRKPLDACHDLSSVADAAVTALLPTVEDDFAQRHGRIPGEGVAILAYGKWGSRELTPESDLDMVVIYDAPDLQTLSDGEKPLMAATWSLRLTQRLVTAVTARTGDGRLFEVDLRLRPNGNDGPIATHVDAFESYHAESAWTWEQMALTRARPVAGSPGLLKRLAAIRREALRRPRDRDELAVRVAEMRGRMARTHTGRDPFDVKHRPGGLVDLDFLAQFLVLAHAAEIPALAETGDARAVFDVAAVAGMLEPELAERLKDGSRFLVAIQLLLRLAGAEGEAERVEREAVRGMLARACDDGSADIRQRLEHVAHLVRGTFVELIGEPA